MKILNYKFQLTKLNRIFRTELTFEKGFSGSVNICNRRGKNLPSGVYFVDIQNDNDLRVVEKIVIIK